MTKNIKNHLPQIIWRWFFHQKVKEKPPIFRWYCWWFRNPANQLRLVAYHVCLSHYLQGFSTIPGGDRRISEPSTVFFSTGQFEKNTHTTKQRSTIGLELAGACVWTRHGPPKVTDVSDKNSFIFTVFCSDFCWGGGGASVFLNTCIYVSFARWKKIGPAILCTKFTCHIAATKGPGSNQQLSRWIWFLKIMFSNHQPNV